ncbi:hypothetical protein V2J09_022654 [Rumex salicifolius]
MSSISIDCGQMSDMSDSSSENETRKTQRSHKGTSSGDSTPGESSSSALLKKGPWTNAEDAILIEYVNKHGEGNWNAVQKYSGLSRCGKSCRLRWANHLRPDLKKGAFTHEEESRIVELHAKIGNKWARMAAENDMLPGRTDNEIKNYWNTRIKRLQRAGLPIYPPEVCMQAMNEGHHSEDAGSGSSGEKNLSETSQVNQFDIPAIEFKGTPSLIDLPANCILNNNMSFSHDFGLILPSIPPQKRLRETDTTFPSSILSTNEGFSSFNQIDHDPYTGQPLWLSSYNPNLNTQDTCPIDILTGSHALINGNNSTSEPISAMKIELPSLQYTALPVVGSRELCSPLPSLESVDTLIQIDCPSPRSSGLLEAIVYESQSLKNSKDHLYPQISVASNSDGLVESSSQNVDETKWDSILDPLSPLRQSVASVFLDYNPHISGSSSEQPQSAEAVQGFNCTQDSADLFSAEYSDHKKDCSNQLEYIRPDALFDSFWVGNRTLLSKDQSITDDIGAIFGDYLNTEYEQAGGASSELK